MDNSQTPRDAIVPTPSDTVTQTGNGVLFAGGAVSVETNAGNNVLLSAAFAGICIPLMVNKVRAAGTTATSILLFR